MQETVTTAPERKSLLSSFLEVLEAQGKQAAADRQLQDERYRRRTQRILEYHDRQRREVVELRRCLDYVSQHAHVLETVLRGAGSAGSHGGEEAPLGANLVRQAATLRGCMAQCVANAARIRQMLAAAHQPQMDVMLAKMESELAAWTAFLHRAVDAAYNTEIVVDNLHNMIAEQRRYVHEVSSSTVFASLCGDSDASAPDTETEAAAGAAADAQAAADGESPIARRPPSTCSTPILID